MMSATTDAFERSLKRQVREAVRASPELWREYRARRSTGLSQIAYAIFISFGGLLMPVVFAWVFIGMGKFSDKGPLAGQGNSPEAALGLSSIVYFGLVLLGSQVTVNNSAARWRIVTVGLFFARSDREIFRDSVWHSTAQGLLATYLSLLIWAWFAWNQLRSTGDWTIALVLWLLYVPVIWSWNVVMAVGGLQQRLTPSSREFRTFLQMSLLFAFVGVLMIAMGAVTMEPFASTLGELGFVISPLGWINGAFCVAVLEKNPFGWIFLMPVLLGIALAAVMYRRGLATHEVQFAVDELDPIATPLLTPSTDSVHVALGPAVPASGTVLSRLWRRIINDRTEVVLMSIGGFGKSPLSTWQWLLCSAPAVIVGITFAFTHAQAPSDPQIGSSFVMIGFFPLAAFVALTVRGGSRDLRSRGGVVESENRRFPRSGAKDRAVCYSCYPVGIREMTGALVRAWLYTVVIWLPSILTSAAIVSLSGRASPQAAILVALAPAAFLLGALGIIHSLMVSSRTNDSARWSLRIIWITAFTLAGASGLTFLFMPMSYLSLVPLLALAAVSWGMWWFYAGVYERGRVDIVR